MSELPPPPSDERPYDFADQSGEDETQGPARETTPDEEPKTLTEQAEELRAEAERIGLPPEDIAQLLRDFVYEHSAASDTSNSEASDGEERGEPNDGAPESLTPREKLEKGFNDIVAALENADKALGSVEGGLEMIAEVLKEFFDKLIELVKQIEVYINKIANSTNELEKRRLAKELQDVINKFGQNGISANAVQPTDSMPAAA